MKRPIALHQISAMEAAPPDFARLAATAGYDGVSLFTFCPVRVLPGQKDRLSFPTTTTAMKRDILETLAANGLEVFGVEFFPITQDADIAAYAPGLELGRELGARRAVTHVHEVDRARAEDLLGALCHLASRLDLTVCIEFTPMTRGCTTLHDALELINRVGLPNLGLGLDCLHFVRSGGRVEELATVDPRCIRYAQICDGHGLQPEAEYMAEAHERALPGEGNFPLVEILSALPENVALEIEVPSARRLAAGGSALSHAQSALACTRSLLTRVSSRR